MNGVTVSLNLDGTLYSATTGSTGRYLISGIPSGVGSLWIFSDLNPSYLTTAWHGGEGVSFTGSARTGYDLAVTKAASVKGTVKGSDTATGLAGIPVEVLDASGWAVSTAFTDAKGAYTVGGLESGTYFLHFQAGGHYEGEYWNDKRTLETSTPIVLATGQTLTARNATLARQAELSGRVTSGGSALAGVLVTVTERTTGATWSSTTAADGSYRIEGLEPGVWTMRFQKPGWVTQYWKARSVTQPPDPITVARSAALTGYDVSMQSVASITGTVRSSSGTGLSGISVIARADTGGEVRTVTGDTGAYRFPGLDAGTWRLEFEGGPDHLTEYWNDKPTAQLADPIVLAQGTTAIADAVLTSAASISGRVTASDGAAITSASVTVTTADGGAVGTVHVDATGSYTVPGLSAGSYRLQFSTPVGGYLAEYWRDAATPEAATLVVVGAGQKATGVDPVLAKAAVITGSITDPGGNAHATRVELYDVAGGLVTSTTSNGSSYMFRDLVPGTYKMHFVPDPQWSTGAAVWLGNATSHVTSPAVVLASGATVVRDVTLPAGGSISGKITGVDPGWDGLGTVTLYSVDGEVLQRVGFDVAVGGGSYTIRGLTTGTYLLSASSTHALDTFYGGTLDLASSTSVAVTAGQAVTARNIALRGSSQLEGFVFIDQKDGYPPAGADGFTVQAVSTTGRVFTTTTLDGYYQFLDLPAGKYVVHADSLRGYAGEWAPGTSVKSKAKTYTAKAYTTVRVSDLVLDPGGWVNGRITADGTSSPLQAIVIAHGPDGVTLTGQSDQYGYYTIGGLATGKYTLEVQYAGDYVPEWWKDASSAATAATFSVTVGTGRSGMDMSLAKGAGLRGTVTVATTPASVPDDARVTIWNTDRSVAHVVDIDEQGRYAFSGLPAGTYSLVFESSTPGFSEAKTTVTLTAGSIKAMNRVIPKNGTIAGTMKDAKGTAIPGGSVYVWRLVDGSYQSYGSQRVDWTGHYSVSLPAGSYVIAFSDNEEATDWDPGSGVAFVNEFWQDRITLETAKVIGLTAGATTTKNPVLARRI